MIDLRDPQRSETDRAGTVDEITSLRGVAIGVVADVTDKEAIADAIGRTESAFGPVQLAVNCAGIANAAPAEEMELVQWERVIQVNLTGVFLSCQAVAGSAITNR